MLLGRVGIQAAAAARVIGPSGDLKGIAPRKPHERGRGASTAVELSMTRISGSRRRIAA